MVGVWRRHCYPPPPPSSSSSSSLHCITQGRATGAATPCSEKCQGIGGVELQNPPIAGIKEHGEGGYGWKFRARATASQEGRDEIRGGCPPQDPLQHALTLPTQGCQGIQGCMGVHQGGEHGAGVCHGVLMGRRQGDQERALEGGIRA